MCGIFGIISKDHVNPSQIERLAKHSQQRGIDSSGLIYFKDGKYAIERSDYKITKLINKKDWIDSPIVLGHSRLVTNGLHDNQPVVRDGIFLLHNGIIVNEKDLWKTLTVEKKYSIDSEVIIGIALECLKNGVALDDLPEIILKKCKGTISAILAFPSKGKMFLFSNNGSLYVGKVLNDYIFASESYPLTIIGCKDIKQIKNNHMSLNIIKSDINIVIDDISKRLTNLIPPLMSNNSEEKLLKYEIPKIRRCTKCILPETMPFIDFDSDGVCNYCRTYKSRNIPRPKEELFKLVEPYRRKDKPDCIVPFSGGRDSSYALHLIVRELGMNPIAYTYDWGMVTDLGRRNISRMCSELGVENIIIAADITKKRENIAKNLKAWLHSPNLGMISILTAGDKHFFKYVDVVKRQTQIDLNLWGINPLEVTHFKSGFLGIKPKINERNVYMQGMRTQLNYHSKRFYAMLQSPGYFNSSLWDTLSGEFYRSFKKKTDYFHIYDYWTWDESIINNTLLNYDWETASDTNATWRIGDGTAAFYNYIYYSVAGFSEHDTFRSNQIREGQLTRQRALELVEDENRPRYPNIRWYLDALDMDFASVIKTINSIPKIY